MQLTLYFSSNDFIKIDILPEFKKWFEFYKEKNAAESNCLELSSRTEPYTRSKIDKFVNKSLIYNAWETILVNINMLEKQMSASHRLNLPASFDFSQQTLNKIHRFFTAHSINSNLPKYLLDPINESVHELESFCSTDNKAYIARQGKIKGLEFRGNSLTKNNYFDLSNLPPISNTIDYSKGIPVLLNDFILGKPYIQAFYDEDNPCNSDITGRTVSDGGFVIDINQNRKKLYQSAKFSRWCKHYGLEIDKLPLENQIGSVTDISCSLKKIYYHFLLGFNLERIWFS